MVKLLVIILATLLIYRKTVYYGYIIDDIQVATHIRPRGFWRNLWWQIKGGAYTNSRVEHTITLLLHTINSCLIFLAFGRTGIAFLASLLFALNPANTQASVWLSGKVYSAAVTMLLLGIWFKWLFPIFYLMGTFFSLNIVLAPLLFLFLQPWFMALMVGFVFIKHKNRLVKEPTRRYNQSTPWMQELSLRKLIICIKTYGYYFKLGVFPTKLGMCHTYLHVFGLSKRETEQWYSLDKYFWLGIAVGIATIASVFFHQWGLVWFTILIAQWCNLMVLNHPICERYLYLPNIGLMLFLSSFLLSLPYGTYLAVAYLTYYAVRLSAFLPAYENNLEYFKSNSENFPDIAIPYNQYALELIRFGNPMSAVDNFMKGLYYRPNDFRCNFNLANLFINLGRFNDAIPFINLAEQNLDPNNNYEVWKNQVESMKYKISQNIK